MKFIELALLNPYQLLRSYSSAVIPLYLAHHYNFFQGTVSSMTVHLHFRLNKGVGDVIVLYLVDYCYTIFDLTSMTQLHNIERAHPSR